ncbi:cytochrome c family protein [Collimonas arenae]|uniref:Cytochrome c family protein n=1 Tax=Collimonas arenae TaxID=279058 RepID=A0A127PTW9_9BURK|nr:cytochrome c [Collimonas arenae]AMP01227.1 cytochrome c family protein [Collimonas arenae]AMP11123.1 cytochrome c family protein [Collimonas arenae]
MKRILIWVIGALVLLAAGAVAVLAMLNADDSGAPQQSAAVVNSAEQLERGAYLVRTGDCMACHTARGGKSLAGARAIQTPFGAIYSPNITSDEETGIGKWSADDFWRALHNGKSKDGSLLYPAFPYTNYTKVTRIDADAMFAYLRSVPAVSQKNLQPDLRFPYSNRILLYGWRALYFRPGVYQPEKEQSVEWNRGAYLVQGLGHCSACHTTRNALGGSDLNAELGGGFIPVINWYAPSLTSDEEIGLGDWDIEHITALLKNGVSPRGTVLGPMAEVVGASLQHLNDPDVRAMAVYLKSLPRQKEASESKERASPDEVDRVLALGGKIYKAHCVDCHQASGKGTWPAYPPLAGNHAITMASPVNAIRVILNGGFAPSTTGNPRPYGMPPYGPALNDSEVAAVVSYIRNSWGNKAPIVGAAEVNRYRAVPLD